MKTDPRNYGPDSPTLIICSALDENFGEPNKKIEGNGIWDKMQHDLDKSI